jgi:hypothetical protein
MSHPAHDGVVELVRDFSRTEVPIQKWSFGQTVGNGRATICIRLWSDSGEVTISHRGVGTDGCMSELNAFSCEVEHLPQLVHALGRALAVAREHGLIKQTSKR